MSRRRWVIGLVSGAVVLTGVVAVAAPRLLPQCGEAVISHPGSGSTSPFLDSAERAEQPDPQRDALVAALQAAGPPYGEVLGAVGYHYEQWAQVAAFTQGIGVRTRDNPDFTMLDDRTLEPRWSVAVDTKRSAYDASDRTYLVATMPGDASPDLVALDASTGRRSWCAAIDGLPVRADDAFATQFLADGDVVVLSRGAGGRERIMRLAASDGSERWERPTTTGEGDFVGDLGEGVLLAGGSPKSRLVDAKAVSERPAGQVLEGLTAETGEKRWGLRASAGTGVHVLAADPESGIAVLEEWTGGTPTGRLFALDRSGKEVWSVSPPGTGYFDAAVRAGRVLVRAATRWSAYDVGSGEQLWQRTVPDRPQFLPYGFELDAVPLLDADHALIGGTTALHALDLTDGSLTPAALPTDGINTTYWPYQVAASDGLIAVATNTGAVVVRRAVVPGW